MFMRGRRGRGRGVRCDLGGDVSRLLGFYRTFSMSSRAQNFAVLSFFTLMFIMRKCAVSFYR
jgi:hypothetical protein